MKFTSEIAVKLVQSCGGDTTIASAAWVSTGRHSLGEDIDEDKVAGLLNFLMKHRHGTPFEHSSMTFFVRAPIFVWREWHRHRIGFSYNEESARYKKLEPEFYIPDRERPLMKVEGWKPGRPKFERCEDEAIYTNLCENLRVNYRAAYQAYEYNLALGVDPGIARACLPVGIYSSCWVTCNPRSLMAFLSLRVNDEKAVFVSYPLHEIQVAAEACEDIFAAGWPLTHRAFLDNGRVAP